MNILTVENLSKSFGNKELFQAINLSIETNERIGLIGRNGQGKTSLLKILAGLDQGDSGQLTSPAGVNIEYLPQNLELDPDLRVIDEVFRGNSSNMKILRQYQEEIGREELNTARIIQLTELMDRDNIWELESEAKTVLTQLGIGDFNKKIGQLSGGQKRRASLASALINDSDLLILDEPTNHLDNKTIEWLEEYLISRKGALLMVTHDRYFLDRVTTRILELENSQIYSYEGNFNYYLEKKLMREEIALAMERKRKSLYKQELAWMRQGIKARGTRQKARLERFHDLKEGGYSLDREEIDISVASQRLGRKIIELDGISKAFGGRPVIDDFSYIVLRGDRIGIVGDNGSGKSTLLNLITGRLEADSGSIELGETVKLGYFSQEAQEMDPDMRAIEYIKEAGEYIEDQAGQKISASQLMERFLFTGKEQWTEIKRLSGGERRRLYLLRVLMAGPNVLILDEPTNDLDIETLQVLEDYLEAFNGPVLAVSHDRYFLDKFSEKIFHVEGGNIREYPGNYTDFRERLKGQAQEEKPKDTLPKKEKTRTSPKNRSLKFSYNEQREWDLIETDILELETALEDLAGQIEENASDYSRLEELLEENSRLEALLEEKMDRWVYLSELKEKIDRQ